MRPRKIRSVLLALVLVLSLGLPRANAADTAPAALKDIDQVTHYEAVRLMADLGVITGKDDGTFAPREAVDRASMAKMLFGILMGDADPNSFVGIATPLTDVAGHWAEGYINYCYTVGIVSGRGNNTFDPGGQVSVASAAKMLLVALGFDAKERGYEGSDLWADNIMRDAGELGLLDGVGQLSFEPLTRDNAAQMIYNALFLNTREPVYRLADGEKKVTGYIEHGTTLGLETFGLVKVVLTVGNVGSTPADLELRVSQTIPTAQWFSGGGTVTDPLRTGNFHIGRELAAGNIAVYAKAGYTMNQETGKIGKLTFQGLYSTEAFPAEIASLGSSAGGTPITAEAGLPSLTDRRVGNTAFLAELDDSPDYSCFINGKWVDLKTANAAASRRGVVVELLDADQDGKADLVKLTVKSVAALTGEVRLRLLDSAREIIVPGVPGLESWTSAADVSGWEDLHKGDVALYVTIGDKTWLWKARVLSGIPAQLRGEGEDCQIRVDGGWYGVSQLTDFSLRDWEDFSAPYWFYLDDNGSILKAVPAED